MEPTFQTTSFIPKKSLAAPRTGSTTTTSIFTVISSVILLCVLGFSVLTYVWNKQLKVDILKAQNTLKMAREKFDQNALTDLQQLDKRINTAEKVLDNHTTVSPILVNVLNANTLKKVQYTQFSHAVTGAGAATKIQVRLSGKAESLPYVALQSKKLADNQYVRNAIFSDIVNAKDGSVTFNLMFDISPILIEYSNYIMRATQSAQKTTTPQPLPELPSQQNTPSTPTSTTSTTSESIKSNGQTTQ